MFVGQPDRKYAINARALKESERTIQRADWLRGLLWSQTKIFNADSLGAKHNPVHRQQFCASLHDCMLVVSWYGMVLVWHGMVFLGPTSPATIY